MHIFSICFVSTKIKLTQNCKQLGKIHVTKVSQNSYREQYLNYWLFLGFKFMVIFLWYASKHLPNLGFLIFSAIKRYGIVKSWVQINNRLLTKRGNKIVISYMVVFETMVMRPEVVVCQSVKQYRRQCSQT